MRSWDNRPNILARQLSSHSLTDFYNTLDPGQKYDSSGTLVTAGE